MTCQAREMDRDFFGNWKDPCPSCAEAATVTADGGYQLCRGCSDALGCIGLIGDELERWLQ